jgi:hypothetical protein
VRDGARPYFLSFFEDDFSEELFDSPDLLSDFPDFSDFSDLSDLSDFSDFSDFDDAPSPEPSLEDG